VAAPVTRATAEGGQLRVDVVVDGRTVHLALPRGAELTASAILVRVAEDGSVVLDGLLPPDWGARGLQIAGPLLAALGAAVACRAAIRQRRHRGHRPPRVRRRTRNRVLGLVAVGWAAWTAGRILDDGVGAWWGGTADLAGWVTEQVGLFVLAATCFGCGAVVAVWAHHHHATLPRRVASASAAVTAASRVLPEPSVLADLLTRAPDAPVDLSGPPARGSGEPTAAVAPIDR
jgi:hypothetical protein